MRTMAIEEFGGPDRLRPMDRPRPRPAYGEILIHVVAAGVNPVDCMIREGRLSRLMPHDFPLVPGWDAAGVVEQLGERILENGRDDFLLMNDFAWKIATEPGLIKRDLELAMRAAQIAYDATEGKNFEVLDTYARVLYERGQKEEAIKYQREAIKLATTDEARQTLQKALTRYEKAAEHD